jgi:hypothetical protein
MNRLMTLGNSSTRAMFRHVHPFPQPERRSSAFNEPLVVMRLVSSSSSHGKHGLTGTPSGCRLGISPAASRDHPPWRVHTGRAGSRLSQPPRMVPCPKRAERCVRHCPACPASFFNVRDKHPPGTLHGSLAIAIVSAFSLLCTMRPPPASCLWTWCSGRAGANKHSQTQPALRRAGTQARSARATAGKHLLMLAVPGLSARCSHHVRTRWARPTTHKEGERR